MKQKITLTESQLRGYVERMVRESIYQLAQEQNLDEGKLARALGAAALGAGLMFGAPQTANAQLNVKQAVKGNARVVLSCYNTNLEEQNGGFYISFQKENIRITLGSDVNQSLQTLYDLQNLISEQAKGVEVGDRNYGDYTLSYGMIGPDHGLYVEQNNNGAQAFLYKSHLDKMIEAMRDSSIFDDKASGYDDYFDDWKGKEATRASMAKRNANKTWRGPGRKQ